MITTIVFDLDDTLYDELEYCKSGFDAVAHFLTKQFSNFSAENIFTALWRKFQTGNHTKTFNAALDALGIKYSPELITQCVQTYRNHNPKITLPKDSRDVLEQLSKKYTLALLTDGFLPAQKLKVRSLGIEKYFKSIIYTEEMGRDCWKPSPAGFEKLMKDLNAKPENCAYVADNPAKDFIAPNRLGFVTVQISRPNRIHPDLPADKDASPTHLIHKLTDLQPLLTKSYAF
jgi:putative hydrolase of the HAD superfamily